MSSKIRSSLINLVYCMTNAIDPNSEIIRDDLPGGELTYRGIRIFSDVPDIHHKIASSLELKTGSKFNGSYLELDGITISMYYDGDSIQFIF